MASQRYTVNQYPIDVLLAWVKSGEIAIPEIQRPFVWNATKVRNLLDSLYQGYPIGYLITWKNPTVRLKDGTLSAGKRILIDGQQRVTALRAALLGDQVLTKSYAKARIRIAFHPLEERFEVANPAIRSDAAWIPDISTVFAPETALFELADAYLEANPHVDRRQVNKALERLKKILYNPVGVIELAEDLDIETVTEIFIRVNSAGVELGQADFAMSKIAASETYGGPELRKAIDYFCHLVAKPEFYERIRRNDPEFADSDFFKEMSWLKDASDDIYVPSYTDVLRVAFVSEFRRGRLQDLVALLSGRNFETRQFEEEITANSFRQLRNGVLRFINRTNFQRLVMILRSAGFVSSRMIRARNAVNFAYIIYLHGRAQRIDAAELERIVRRWFVMSLLTARYTGHPETIFDWDIRQIESRGLEAHARAVIEAELSSSFWSSLLPQHLETASLGSPYFTVFQAAQVKDNGRGFLSRDITVQDLILNRSDVHHVFPRNHLKKKGLSRGQYNQVANLVLAQSEINIAIGDKPPSVYFRELAEQCSGGPRKYGGITDFADLRENLRQHCIPEGVFGELAADYQGFLEERRRLMAAKIEEYFARL